MSHLDEEFINLRSKQPKAINPDLETVHAIEGHTYQLTPVNFFENQLEVRIPASFTNLPLEQAKMKYPSEQRPQIIKSNEDGSINLTFSLLNEPLTTKDLPQALDSLQAVIARLNPANLFFAKEVSQTTTGAVGYFDFKSSALDSDLYNIMFATPIGGKFLLGTFNCRFSAKAKWTQLARAIMRSCKDLTK